MKKNIARTMLAIAVLLVVYQVVVFALPFLKNLVFWLSYGFTLASFVLAAGSIYIAFNSAPDTKSRFYGFPIARVGVIYWVFQVVAGLIFMGLSMWVPWWLALVVYVIALGAAAVGLIGTNAVAEEVVKQDTTLKTSVSLMRSLQAKVGALSSQCRGDSAHAMLLLADAFRYSDPVSSASLEKIELQLSTVIEDLQKAVALGDTTTICDLCKRASVVLEERNRLCKLGK